MTAPFIASLSLDSPHALPSPPLFTTNGPPVLPSFNACRSSSNCTGTWLGGGFFGKWAGAPYKVLRSLAPGDEELLLAGCEGRWGIGIPPSVDADVVAEAHFDFWFPLPFFLRLLLRPPEREVVLLGTKEREFGLKSERLPL